MSVEPLTVSGFDVDAPYYYTVRGGKWRVSHVMAKAFPPSTNVVACMQTPWGLMKCSDINVRMIGPVPAPTFPVLGPAQRD